MVKVTFWLEGMEWDPPIRKHLSSPGLVVNILPCLPLLPAEASHSPPQSQWSPSSWQRRPHSWCSGRNCLRAETQEDWHRLLYSDRSRYLLCWRSNSWGWRSLLPWGRSSTVLLVELFSNLWWPIVRQILKNVQNQSTFIVILPYFKEYY